MAHRLRPGRCHPSADTERCSARSRHCLCIVRGPRVPGTSGRPSLAVGAQPRASAHSPEGQVQSRVWTRLTLAGRPPAALLLPGFRAAWDRLGGQRRGTRLPGGPSAALQLLAGGTALPALPSPSVMSLPQSRVHAAGGAALAAGVQGQLREAAHRVTPSTVYTGRPRELAAPTPGSTSAPHAGWGCTQPPAQHGPRKGPQTHLGFHQNADDISHETVTAPGCDREAPKSTPARRRHKALPPGTGPLAPSLPGRHVPTGREEGRAGAAPGPGWRRRGPGAHGETRGGEQGPGLASANARWFPRKEDLAVRFLTALRVSDGARPPRRHLPPHSQCPEAHARAQNRLRLEAHES